MGGEGEGGGAGRGGSGSVEGLGPAVAVTASSSSPPPPRLHGSDRDLLLGLELLPGERQEGHDASSFASETTETEVAKETGGVGTVGKTTVVGETVGETASAAPASTGANETTTATTTVTATVTANGEPAESSSLVAAASSTASDAPSSSAEEAAPDAGDRGDVSRPALHPFDSLSSPLSIGDCFKVAQQQSRGVLSEAAETTSGVKLDEAREGEGRPRQWRRRRPRPLAAASSRDSRGRVRLGFVSGDLMGTHPLTHLMQAREKIELQ